MNDMRVWAMLVIDLLTLSFKEIVCLNVAVAGQVLYVWAYTVTESAF